MAVEKNISLLHVLSYMGVVRIHGAYQGDESSVRAIYLAVPFFKSQLIDMQDR